jgi:hypothetical protein
MVVTLLSLEQWRNVHGANRSINCKSAIFFAMDMNEELFAGEIGFASVQYSIYDNPRLLWRLHGARPQTERGSEVVVCMGEVEKADTGGHGWTRIRIRTRQKR